MTAPLPYEAIDIRLCRGCHTAYPSSRRPGIGTTYCPDCRTGVAEQTHVEVTSPTDEVRVARRACLTGWLLRCRRTA